MTLTDQWGCPTTADPDEVELIEQSVSEYLTMTPDIAKRLPALGEGGPMARALLSMLLTQSHRPTLVHQAGELADKALTEKHLVSRRERAHIEAAVAWAQGDIDSTVAIFGAVLEENATDMLAIRSRYLLLFSTGRIDEMVTAIPDVRSSWSPDLPMASYLDGMEAFALEESGSYRQAEILGRRGVERERRDLWAIHSVAHVLEMESRRDEGVAWLEQNRDVMGGGGFAGHLWWHLALQLWALGRNDEALSSFDEHVYPGLSEEGLDLTNAVSLLARLESSGVEVAERWESLAEPVAARIGQHSHPFNDTHFALALARGGHLDDAKRLVDEMRAWSQRDDTAAAVLRVVGVAVAEAMVAFGTGQWQSAVDLLDPVHDEVWRLGGSHAQRFVYSMVHDTARHQATATA